MSLSIAEEKAIKTQLSIVSLPITDDVMNIIKSFIFYDRRTYVSLMVIKIYRSRMNNQIKKSIKYYYPLLPLSPYSVYIHYIERQLQIHECVCIVCGKFVHIVNNQLIANMPPNRYLYCINNHH